MPLVHQFVNPRQYQNRGWSAGLIRLWRRWLVGLGSKPADVRPIETAVQVVGPLPGIMRDRHQAIGASRSTNAIGRCVFPDFDAADVTHARAPEPSQRSMCPGHAQKI